MPFAHCIYSGPYQDKARIGDAIGAAISRGLKKPIEYVCVNVTHSDGLTFGGSAAPCAMIHVQSIGGSLSSVCGPITEQLSMIAGIDSDRIFVNFESFEGKNWAMGGNTF